MFHTLNFRTQLSQKNSEVEILSHFYDLPPNIFIAESYH